MRIRLERVRLMPKGLKHGVLYVSEEFGTAAHLCPCGCGSKIRTPLGPTEWTFTETKLGPSLDPSIGNWQRACQSHYWILNGEIIWAKQWTSREISAGRAHEEERRRRYHEAINRTGAGILARLLRRIAKLFRS